MPISLHLAKPGDAENEALSTRDFIQQLQHLRSSEPPKDMATLCRALSLRREAVWRSCESHLKCTPSQLLDWLKASAWLRQLPETKQKILSTGFHFGFRSQSAFIAFSRRMFGMTPSDVRTNLVQARETFESRFSNLCRFFEGLEKHHTDSIAPVVSTENQVVLSSVTVDSTKPKHKTEAQNRSTKPKHKIEAQNRSTKPKTVFQSEVKTNG